MKKYFVRAMCLFYAGFLMAQSPASLQVKELKLNNGLTVWLNEDPSLPKVFGAVVVRAGSKDSPDTGIAHYFEHIMFKGTDRIGTVDYAAEKVYLDSIAAKYDELSRTAGPAERNGIQQEINRLSVRAAKYAIPNEFSRLISQYGGTDLNAFTSYDCTVYHNTFSPQYFAQWAELNSQRLIRPVFRLFQNELETVYEEKNMYSDNMISGAMEKFSDRFFTPHPYRYPIVGSTENLKNPKLSEMERFFKTYYVANNMGLVLSGDFKAEEVIPLLEQTFGKIPGGDLPQRDAGAPAPFHGKEKMEVKIPLPLVKIFALGFRGVPANHPDEPALDLLVRMLNNANGTGYLDLLSVNHQILEAQVFNLSLNDAGLLGILVVPKLLFQSKDKAEKLVWEQIDRIKNGDFSEELFNNLKLEVLVGYEKTLETPDSRAAVMINLLSQGSSWEDFLKRRDRIESLTRDDLMRVARNYFGKDYLYAFKKMGSYPKDKLEKPSFEPVIPEHRDEQSAYALRLEQLPVGQRATRFLDFSRDTKTVQLSPDATLYVTPNPVNDLFSLDIHYHAGTFAYPAAALLGDYLTLLGTDSLTFEKFREKLQALGSTLTFTAEPNSFVVEVTGFDKYYGETLSLVGDFLTNVRADENKMKLIRSGEKMSDKSFFESADQVAQAAFEKVMFGPQSLYLTKLSYKEAAKLKGSSLVELLDKIRQTACSFHYSGNLPDGEVAREIRRTLAVEKITLPPSVVMYRQKQFYDKPAVYFFDQPGTAQSIIYGYIADPAPADDSDKAASQLFGNYFGGDMSSLMFQELREFRSYAYRASGSYSMPSPAFSGKGGALTVMLSTQRDKTIDAMGVLDSLIRFMPEKPRKALEARQRLSTAVNNNYPGFRNVSAQIDKYRQEGYADDPNRILNKLRETMDMQDIMKFYETRIRNHPVIYIVVGDSRKMDLNKLESFGELIRLKRDDIYN